MKLIHGIEIPLVDDDLVTVAAQQVANIGLLQADPARGKAPAVDRGFCLSHPCKSGTLLLEATG